MSIKNLWGPHLYIPSNNVGFIYHVPLLNVRSVVLDLEDATPYSQKSQGRLLIKYAIKYLRDLCPNLIITVRINRPNLLPELCQKEINNIVKFQPNAICIPFVNSANDVICVDEWVTEAEENYKLTVGKIALHPMIESPQGVKNIDLIAAASSRNEALSLGGTDWRETHGISMRRFGKELNYIKTCMISAAAEHKLFVFDTVYPELSDIEGLKGDCQNSRELGIEGKAISTPQQIKIVDEVFRPSKDKIAWASELLAKVEQRILLSRKIYVFDERIIDELIIFQAKKVLAYLS